MEGEDGCQVGERSREVIMPRFKIVVLSRIGNAKYTYSQGSFSSMKEAIDHHEGMGGRVIEAKEMNVKLVSTNSVEDVSDTGERLS